MTRESFPGAFPSAVSSHPGCHLGHSWWGASRPRFPLSLVAPKPVFTVGPFGGSKYVGVWVPPQRFHLSGLKGSLNDGRRVNVPQVSLTFGQGRGLQASPACPWLSRAGCSVVTGGHGRASCPPFCARGCWSRDCASVEKEQPGKTGPK